LNAPQVSLDLLIVRLETDHETVLDHHVGKPLTIDQDHRWQGAGRNRAPARSTLRPRRKAPGQTIATHKRACRQFSDIKLIED
jgi:hypothetical protein